MISNLSLKISDVNLFKLILKWMFLCLPFYLWRYGKWSIRHAAHNMSHETVNQYSQFTNETLLIRKYLDISICKNAFYDNSPCFRLYSVAMEVNTLCISYDRIRQSQRFSNLKLISKIDKKRKV